MNKLTEKEEVRNIAICTQEIATFDIVYGW